MHGQANARQAYDLVMSKEAEGNALGEQRRSVRWLPCMPHAPHPFQDSQQFHAQIEVV